MKKYGKLDSNQKEIVKALRYIPGCSVQSLASMGNGCPDLLIGYRGKNYLFEIKDGKKPQSQRRLTDDELKWINDWEGSVFLAMNVGDILDIINK